MINDDDSGDDDDRCFQSDIHSNARSEFCSSLGEVKKIEVDKSAVFVERSRARERRT